MSEKNEDESIEKGTEESSEEKPKKSRRRHIPTLRPDSPPVEFIQYMLTGIGFYDYLLSEAECSE